MSIQDIADIRDDGTASLKEGIELTEDVAEVLANHDGPVEVMDISTMPEDFAEIVVQHNGKGLVFNHTNADGPRLSVKAAETLATYNGKLTINDINKLNYGDLADEVEIAKALAKHKGELVLGISQISTPAATELFKHEGPLHVDGLYDDASDELLALLEEAEKRWSK
jgi:hypothetical protein